MTHFETKRISLAPGDTPIDLAADPDIGLTADIGATWVAVQNVSTRIARFQETSTAPAGTATDTGHVLPGGAGVVLQLVHGGRFFIWSASGVILAISAAAPSPTRRA